MRKALDILELEILKRALFRDLTKTRKDGPMPIDRRANDCNLALSKLIEDGLVEECVHPWSGKNRYYKLTARGTDEAFIAGI